MKKTISLLLTLMLCLAVIFACGIDDTGETDNKSAATGDSEEQAIFPAVTDEDGDENEEGETAEANEENECADCVTLVIQKGLEVSGEIYEGSVGINGLRPNDPDGTANLEGGIDRMFAANLMGKQEENPWIADVIVYFDLSMVQIPENATVESVKLSLYASKPSWWFVEMEGFAKLGLYRITDDENRGIWFRGVGNNGAVSVNERNVREHTPWIEGGNIYDSIVKEPSVSKEDADTVLFDNWFVFESEDLKNDVVSWLNGNAPNQGWLMRQTGDASVFGFCSPENINLPNDTTPKLEIRYHLSK